MTDMTKQVQEHLDLSRNHEAGLIPVSTQILLEALAARLSAAEAEVARLRSPEVLAADATAQAMLAAAFDGIEERLMDAVWEALKADANDLRKQQRILRAYRALTPADAASALARLLAEARTAALDEAKALVRQMTDCGEAAMNLHDAIDALKGATP